MTKRKQDLLVRQLNDTSDFDEEWSNLREIGKAKQRDRVRSLPNKATQKPCKTPYVDCVTTRRVRFDEVKSKYFPIEEKQNVEILENLTFEVAHQKIWDYYLQKHQDLSPETHEMHIITGVFGPKVFSTVQLGGKKDLFVQFSEKDSRNNDRDNEYESNPKRMKYVSRNRSPEKIESKVAKSVIPRLKLTNLDIMSMGRTITQQLEWEVAGLCSFIQDTATDKWIWSELTPVKLHRGTLVGSGAFRNAFKCSLQSTEHVNSTAYVYKEFNSDAVNARMENFKTLGMEADKLQVIKDLNQKAVQSQACAKVLAQLFSDRLGFETLVNTPSYISSWLVEFGGGEVRGTVEEFLVGKFTKHLNNSMHQVDDENKLEDDIAKKAKALAHFSHELSNGQYLLTDIQGVGYRFTDPEIATKSSLMSENGAAEMLFGAGNLSEAIQNFEQSHKCNKYCEMAKLYPLLHS